MFIPPPAGYLIPPAYRTHRPGSRSHAEGRQPFNLCSREAARKELRRQTSHNIDVKELARLLQTTVLRDFL
jgi:hypothetical protein